MPKTPNLEAQVDGPQYLGPATFMKVRMLTEPAELDELRPDVAIVGAPWDDSTTYRPGARFGPRAVRVANYQPPSWHLDLEVAPFEVLSVVDYGDAVCYPGRADQAHEAIRARVAEIASRQIVPIIIGGDHSITYPSATAVADARSEEHTSELQSRFDLVCRLLLEKKKKHKNRNTLISAFYRYIDLIHSSFIHTP